MSTCHPSALQTVKRFSTVVTGQKSEFKTLKVTIENVWSGVCRLAGHSTWGHCGWVPDVQRDEFLQLGPPQILVPPFLFQSAIYTPSLPIPLSSYPRRASNARVSILQYTHPISISTASCKQLPLGQDKGREGVGIKRKGKRGVVRSRRGWCWNRCGSTRSDLSCFSTQSS